MNQKVEARLQEKETEIQRYNQKLREGLDRRETENAELKRSVEDLKALVNSLAQKLNGDK